VGKFEEAVVAPRRAFARVAGIEVIERPAFLQVRHRAFRTGGYNEVAHCADEDVEIDAVIAGYRARGLAFRWYVAPDSAPAHLAELLLARGFRVVESLALCRDTSPVDGPGDVELITADTLAEYTETMAAAWGIDPRPLIAANEQTLASEHHRLYLARLDGRAVGASGLVMFPRSAYLIGGVVRPEARHRGAYRAMVARRIADARAAGLELVTTRAIAATSAPILQRLGFEVVATVNSYHDRVNEDFVAMRAQIEDAYRQLTHEAREAFDLACAERALAQHDHAIAKRLLRLARDGAPPAELEPVREALDATIERTRGAEDHPMQIGVAVARAVMGATQAIQRGLANSDNLPTSADETRTAVYLATFVRTQDLDAAEAARDAELRWQLAQLQT